MSNEVIFGIEMIFSIISFIAFLFVVLHLKSTKKWVKVIGLIVSIILLGTYTTVSVIQLTQKQAEISKVKEKAKTTKHLKTAQKQEFTKKEAVNAAVSMLKDIQKDDIDKQLKLAEDNNSKIDEVVPKNSLNWIYLTDYMNKDEIEKTTVLSLLSFVQQLQKNGNKDIKPLSSDFDNIIYIDSKTKTAQVPVNLFTGTYGSISFEMVYINNQWRFSPYTFLESVALSNQVQQVFTNSNNNKE